MIGTRVAFEAELRKRAGLEFMVASSQMDFGLPDVSQSQGRWVMRKQERKKRSGAADEVTVLATYFVLGETIYMAPSVGRILWGKLVGNGRDRERARNVNDAGSCMPQIISMPFSQRLQPYHTSRRSWVITT